MKQWHWIIGILLALPVGAQAAETSSAPSSSTGMRSTNAAAVAPGTPAGTYDFGDFSSKTLVGRAWDALAHSDYAAV